MVQSFQNRARPIHPSMIALEIIGCLVLGQALVLGVLAIVTLTTQARRTGGHIARLKDTWHDLLPAALGGEAAATDRIRKSLHSRADWAAFHAFVDEQLRCGQCQSALRLRRLCRAVGLTERLQLELLGARDPLDRAAAGRTLARLRESIAQNTVLELLDAKDPAVVLAAAYATASFRDSRHLLRVFRAVYQRTPITLHGAAELLSAFGEDSCLVIHGLLKGVTRQYLDVEMGNLSEPIDTRKEIDRNDSAAQVVLVDLLAFFDYRPASSTLCRLLAQSTDDEVLIHLAKAIALIGDVDAVPGLTRLLTHPNWVVRDQSVQALAKLHMVETVPVVHALLADDNPSVRASAREALVSLESARSALLEEVEAALA
jgi:hypothetical protein